MPIVDMSKTDNNPKTYYHRKLNNTKGLASEIQIPWDLETDPAVPETQPHTLEPLYLLIPVK